MNYTVYKIENMKTGNYYVGLTKNPKTRMRNHISTLIKDKHPSKVMSIDFALHGKGSFVFTPVFVGDYADCVKMESHLIQLLRPKYNSNTPKDKPRIDVSKKTTAHRFVQQFEQSNKAA